MSSDQERRRNGAHAAESSERSATVGAHSQLDLPLRRQVLDKGWVQLEDLMGGDSAVIRGARTQKPSFRQSDTC